MQELIEANASFYRSFVSGDTEAMAALWADDDTISCIHPGWPAIVGRKEVVKSWMDIMRGSGRPAVVCHEPHGLISGEEGRVLCVEIIDRIALAASNHFRLIDGVWRLVHHQSSQIVIGDRPSESPPPSSHSVH